MVINEKVLIVKINEDILDPINLYKRSGIAWVGNQNRLEDVDYVFSAYKGIVKEIYIPKKWLPEKVGNKIRWKFEGEIAPVSMRGRYISQDVSNYFGGKGSQNPIKYVNC